MRVIDDTLSNCVSFYLFKFTSQFVLLIRSVCDYVYVCYIPFVYDLVYVPACLKNILYCYHTCSELHYSLHLHMKNEWSPDSDTHMRIVCSMCMHTCSECMRVHTAYASVPLYVCVPTYACMSVVCLTTDCLSAS